MRGAGNRLTDRPLGYLTLAMEFKLELSFTYTLRSVSVMSQ